MRCRQTIYATTERRKLIVALGPRCIDCGTDDMEVLEIDHIHGRDWVLKDFSSSARVARYKREFAEGKLQVLCGTCNKAKRFRKQEVKPESQTVDGIWNTDATGEIVVVS